jgi:hypothetical protein
MWRYDIFSGAATTPLVGSRSVYRGLAKNFDAVGCPTAGAGRDP